MKAKKNCTKCRKRAQQLQTTVLVFIPVCISTAQSHVTFQWGLCRLSSRIPLRLSGEGNRSALSKRFLWDRIIARLTKDYY